MKSNLIIFLFSLVSLAACKTPGGAGGNVPLDQQELNSVSNQVFLAFQANDYSRIEPMLLQKNDLLELIEEAMKEVEVSEDQKAKAYDELERKGDETVQKRAEANKKSFNTIYTAIKDGGNDWKKSSLADVVIKTENEGGFEMKSVDLKIDFEGGGQEIIRIKDCTKMSRGWIIGEAFKHPRPE